MAMMLPPPFAIMPGTVCWQRKNVASRLTAMTLRQISGVISMEDTLGRRGVADENIDRTVLLADRLHHSCRFLRVAHVGQVGARAAAVFFDAGNDLLQALPVSQAVYGHGGAFAGKSYRYGSSEVAAGTGHQRDPVLKFLHLPPPALSPSRLAGYAVVICPGAAAA